jgi:hypothetical protein
MNFKVTSQMLWTGKKDFDKNKISTTTFFYLVQKSTKSIWYHLIFYCGIQIESKLFKESQIIAKKMKNFI